MFKTAISMLILTSALSTMSSTEAYAASNFPIVMTDSATSTGTNEASQEHLLDINTASAEELTALPGIGKKKAEAIVQFREDIGGFKDINELKDVRGIGDKLFERVSALIRV